MQIGFIDTYSEILIEPYKQSSFIGKGIPAIAIVLVEKSNHLPDITSTFVIRYT